MRAECETHEGEELQAVVSDENQLSLIRSESTETVDWP